MTPALSLRPLAAEHVEPMSTWLADPAILAFVPVPDPVPDDLARQWFERYERGRQEAAPLGFAAEDRDGTLVGLGVVAKADRRALTVELGYIVAPASRGRGVGRALLDQLTTWAFDEGYQRAALVIDVDNTGSLALARSAGYLQEGVLRSSILRRGERRDATLWSRLPSDPAPIAP